MERILLVIFITFSVISFNNVAAEPVINEAAEERLRYVERQIQDELDRMRLPRESEEKSHTQRRKQRAVKRLDNALDKWLEKKTEEES